MIKISNLDKYYNKSKENQIHVIDNVSLELPDKGLVAILGKSGSGKTTLLNAIGGLDSYERGKIELDNKLIDKYDSEFIDSLRSSKIGYIFQNYNLIDNKTVYENLEISLKIAGLNDKSEQEKRINYALTLVDLIKYKRRKANTLSGGQQQRVGIARAIVKGPSIIIADEPTGNLDSDNTFIIMDLLKSISKTCLVVLVTHEEEIANFFADRIIRISDGKIIDDYINDCNEDLVVKDNKNIFLKDLNVNRVIKKDNININILSDSDTALNLNLIIKGERIYIDAFNTNMPVSVIDNKSEVKLVDAHYEDKKKGKHKTIDINTEILSEVKTKERKNVIDKLLSLKNSWKNYKNIPSKRKIPQILIMYLATVLVTIFTVVFCSILIYDPTSYNVNKNLINFYNSINVDKDLLIQNEGNNGIHKVISTGIIDFDRIVNLSPLYSYNRISTTTYVFPISTLEKYDLICGNMPINENEAIVDINILKNNSKYYGFYNEDLKNYGIRDPKLLLNETLKFGYSSYKICGVIDSGYQGAWIKDEVYSIDKNSKIIILCNDKETFTKWADEKGYKYEDYYKFHLMLHNGKKSGLITSIVILSIIGLIFMMFVFSSNVKFSFLKNIKEIGILRAIGIKKRELKLEYIYQNLIMLFFSGMLGILTVIIIMPVIAPVFIYTEFDFYKEGITDVYAYLIISAILLIVNVGITFIKVSSLLKHTPAEIMSKYDI